MVRVIRSAKAEQEIIEAVAYTKEHWGEAQAREYRQLIETAIRAIAKNPKIGRSYSDVRPEIRGYRIRQPGRPARHILFYLTTTNAAVKIVRFLHEAMDLEQHISLSVNIVQF